MMYKLYEEDGEYLDITTNEPRDLQWCEIAFTPEGINVGWTEFQNEEEAMIAFNIKKKG